MRNLIYLIVIFSFDCKQPAEKTNTKHNITHKINSDTDQKM